MQTVIHQPTIKKPAAAPEAKPEAATATPVTADAKPTAVAKPEASAAEDEILSEEEKSASEADTLEYDDSDTEDDTNAVEGGGAAKEKRIKFVRDTGADEGVPEEAKKLLSMTDDEFDEEYDKRDLEIQKSIETNRITSGQGRLARTLLDQEFRSIAALRAKKAASRASSSK